MARAVLNLGMRGATSACGEGPVTSLGDPAPDEPGV